MRKVTWFVALASAMGAAGCIGFSGERDTAAIGINWDNPSKGPTGRWQGQTEFESAGPWTHIFGPMLAERAVSAEGASAQRAIEESDIYKAEGNKLYVLNPTRGLMVIDIANPDHPRILGRASIYGTPQQMYVRGNLAFVMMNDYYTWSQNNQQFHGSQVLVVDVSDPTRPALTSAFPVAGDVQDSRIVGDAMYVVSTQSMYQNEEWVEKTYLLSLDLANPMAIAEVDREAFEGSGYLINVTEDYIFVADYQWGDNPTTRIQAVNIMDPHGQMFLGAATQARGQIQDKFMMSYNEGYLRVVSSDWEDGGKIFVETFKVNASSNAVTGAGFFEVPGDNGHAVGTLTAARFDGNRAYLVHQVNIDPIDVVDLADPTHPKILDRMEIPGWLEYLEPHGNKLVALGFDQPNGPAPAAPCAGFSYQPLTQGRQLAVALFDVTDPTNICMAAHARFSGENDWVSSNGFYDDKALRFMEDQKLMLVPMNAWTNNGNENSVQMIDVDLACMPNMDCNAVTVRGRVQNVSTVDRSFIARDRLMALSDRELVVANIANRDQPNVTGALELSRNVTAFAPIPLTAAYNIGVQLVGEYDEDAELRVVGMDNPDADKGDVMGTVKVGGSAGDMFVNGATVTVVSRRWTENEQLARIATFDVADPGAPRALGSIEVPVGYGGGIGWMPFRRRWTSIEDVVQVRPDLFLVSAPEENGTRFRAVSIADPAHPEVVYEHPREDQENVIVDFKIWPEAKSNQTGWYNRVYVVSYTPVATTTEPAIDANVGVVPEDGAAPLHHSIMPWGHPTRERVKYYVTRVTLNADADPTIGARINTPGQLVDVSPDGKFWALLDSRWNEDNTDSQGRAIFSVRPNLTKRTAALADGIQVDEGVSDVTVRGGAMYFTAERSWRGPIVALDANGDEAQPEEPRFKLFIVNYTNPESMRNASQYTFDSEGGYGNLLDVREVGTTRYAFVSMGWGGLAVLDVTNGAHPQLDQFVRSNSWFSGIVVSSDHRQAYFAGGYYGVQTVNLGVHATQ